MNKVILAATMAALVFGPRGADAAFGDNAVGMNAHIPANSVIDLVVDSGDTKIDLADPGCADGNDGDGGGCGCDSGGNPGGWLLSVLALAAVLTRRRRFRQVIRSRGGTAKCCYPWSE